MFATRKHRQMKNLVVIGNGMVGYKFCEKIKAYDQNETFKVTVLGKEEHPAYDRVHLSEYFVHQDASQLYMAASEWYADNNIDLHLNDPAVTIDKANKKVISSKGLSFDYDVLVFATGSEGFVPPIKGIEKEGVFVYRAIKDLDQTIAYGKNIKRGAVLGGGLLGLEAAKALLDMNLEAHVVEFAPRLMPRQLDEAAAELLKTKIESLGVKIHLSKSTKEIMGEGKMTGLDFGEEKLEVEMLVVSAGIRPNDALAKEIDLEVGIRGGIVIDDYLQTSEKDIYAIGEAALHGTMIYGLIAPGYEMADFLANNLILDQEEKKTFTGFDMSTKLKLIGVEVGSFGDALGESDCVPIVYQNAQEGIYKRINISKDGKKLLGGILVGDTSDYGMLHQMFLNEMKVPEKAESLILPSIDGAGLGISISDLPDSATICSCENISKGQIGQSILDGESESIDDLKNHTKSGTGCGGCVPMMKDVLDATLTSMGKEVKNVICEHFNYNRQELLDLVKINQHKDYNSVLDKHGTGDGCEICKPLIGSVLASTWNDPILENGNDTAQDTNDRFLANIQRGGSYSVVPRIPAGEITPEKLIVIGQVAKKYDLYTKITGGQRIDMFGAQLNDLPDIWEELINAGFETGQAYGKSLRTVKSCVGSSWCRYGVQDAVGFAIRVENRYKGLRSPHKIKSGVSGCTRECAEAKGKDFGIIATEKGWNLYVGGNGGTTPKHAELLAMDLDDETCLKYIDRFLMFYIKTAEPLMRTAAWLSKLEGGINYLKEVIIEDSLGIVAELDAQMQHQVDTFHCEWADVVNDPEKRKKFKHFTNSNERDSTLEFVPMREQKMPKPW